ncbi:DUF3788 family protein [Roseimarinus sediminis]|jgi:hypothetical protein|uniref:DUF3788 family protein n=1 Tax=Roseimarinus sediminis TaxID=1610899 RepID=UPI003D1919CF
MNEVHLRDPQVFPDEQVLEAHLGNGFNAYQLLMNTLAEPPHNLLAEWRYYQDGKAWLCKVQKKKQTIFWLSVGEAFFTVAFYFNAKNRQGVEELDIAEAIKQQFREAKAIGKLQALVLDISQSEQLDDLLKIISYKSNPKDWH